MSDTEAPDVGLEAALDLLEAMPGDVGPLLAAGDEAAAALRRQPLAAITALAWTLPPEAPPPELRERLMARLSGDETQMVPAGSLLGDAAAATPPIARPAAPGVPPVAPPPRPTPLPRPAAAPPVAPRRAPAPRPPAPRPIVARRWAWPAVAALAAAAIALGGLSANLWQELGRTREQLRRQEADRRELAGRVAQLEGAAAAAGSREELAALRAQLALVTAPTTEVCPLRPPVGQPLAAEARGLLYVAADHQHWYLRAQGLEPPGEGRVYHLWFIVGDRPVSAGTFRLEGTEGEMTSPTMPEGTQAAAVSVEPEGSLGERPTGPIVLYGSEMSRLL